MDKQIQQLREDIIGANDLKETLQAYGDAIMFLLEEQNTNIDMMTALDNRLSKLENK